MKYFDVIAFYLILPVIAYIKSSVTNNTLPDIDGKGFLVDEPIGVDGEDELQRGKVAKEIADRIKNTRNNTSVAIGINGKWGSGKTSFLNLIRREINNETSIIVDFNPWLSKSPDLLINDFFETLSQKLTQYDSSIGHKLNSYAQKLTEIDSNSVTKTLRTTIDYFFPQKTVTRQKDAINTIIKSTGKQVIILIDDLDRLDKKEVIETIRLIRNTANFQNTFFIVAYDREYVIKALSGITDHSPEFYLEKIFQIELSIPAYEKTILVHKLYKGLNDSKELSEPVLNEIERILFKKDRGSGTLVENYLLNIRDVSRFINSFTLSLKMLNGEVKIADLINIECIRLKYPSVYNLLQTDYDEIFTDLTNDKKTKTEYIRLDSFTTTDNKAVYYLQKILEEKYFELGIPKSEITSIVKNIDFIFSEAFLSNSENENSHLLIRNPKAFDRYFAIRLLKNDLSNIEFNAYRLKPIKEFKAQITKWSSSGLSYEVGLRLESVKKYITAEDFEKIIECIFYLSNLPDSRYGNPNRWLLGTIVYDRERIINGLYNSNAKKYEESISRILLKTDPEYLSENNFRTHLLNDNLDTLIPKEILQEANIESLNKYLAQVDGFTNFNWRYWHNCSINSPVPQSNGSYIFERQYPESANQLMRNFIVRSFDTFIIAIIDHADPELKNVYKISNIINTLYGNYANFETTVIQLSEEKVKYLVEFKTFLKKYAENKFNPTEFEFETIPVVNRWYTNQ
ncbi:MAG: KAP family NTPase [Chitinophagales bacterium]|nr:KAP family NTPase [Chitinophagales bacterium]